MPNSFHAPMARLKKDAWFAALADIGDVHGFSHSLGPDHTAAFIHEGDTLVVTFESRQNIQSLSDMGHPFGFELVQATGWSHLALVSEGDTWFRDPHVIQFFHDLDDEGFFDNFKQLLFYGAGPCGYAAAAFARAAQDAIVVAIQPQATLEARLAGWDDRFTRHRIRDFSGDFGFAPEFTELSEQTFIIYDPHQPLDAMHAALFEGPKTTLLRTPFMGQAVQSSLLDMALLFRILVRAGSGRLNEAWFHALLRARRTYPPYLRNLMSALERNGRYGLLETLCTNVTTRMKAPRFQRKLMELRAD
ncbi:MAG: phosphoadenosine phosphosulfate reductase [Marinovum sp.]|nr:phosphoadenosine phosphosulfate reductase [Marinovum sp.]